MSNLHGQARLAKNKGSIIHNDPGLIEDIIFTQIKSIWPTTVISSIINKDGDEVVDKYITAPANAIPAQGVITADGDDEHFTAMTYSGGGAAVELTLD